MELTIQPIQWNNCRDISEIGALSDEDMACLAEIRDVLRRHGRLDRFGINMLHKHFKVADDECLMEYTDAENRILTTRPVKMSEVDLAATTVTLWRLTEDGHVAEAGCRCAQTSNGHGGYHQGF